MPDCGSMRGLRGGREGRGGRFLPAYPGGLQREVFAEALCSFGRETCGIRSEARRKSPVSGKDEKRQGREPARRTRCANSASCSRSTSGWNCTPNSRSPHSIASAVPSAARADTVSRGEGCDQRLAPRVIPDREALKSVYDLLRKHGGMMSAEEMYLYGGGELNYCILRISLDVFAAAGMAEFSADAGTVRLIPVKQKIDLMSVGLLAELRRSLSVE